MATGKRLSKKQNIKKWKKGINNVKQINIVDARDQKKGTRL